MGERASFVCYIIASVTSSELLRVRDAIRQHMIVIIQQIYAHAKCENVICFSCLSAGKNTSKIF